MLQTRRQFLTSAAAIAATGTTTAALGRSLFNAVPPRKYELGLVTYNVAKDWDLPTILETCEEVGIAAVELRTTHRHGVEPSLDTAQRREVKSRFSDSKVKFWGSGSTCEFHSPDKAVVEKNIEDCKKFIELVADLGGTGVKVRPNGLPQGVPIEKTLEQIGTALKSCGDAAERAGVEIWVEVHGGGTQEPKNMHAIMEACDHKNVGVTWNSNSTDVKGGSVSESFALLRPWIKSCHITDLKSDATGKYPYRELFRLFRETGYDRYTLIEYGTPYPNVAEGKAFLRDYRTLWEQLTTA